MLVIFAIFVLLSISNGGLTSIGGVVDEDDLQLYEEWKANKARVDAQALTAEGERRKGYAPLTLLWRRGTRDSCCAGRHQ